MARQFRVKMRDTYDIPGERIVVSNGGPKGYVFVDITDRKSNTFRIGLAGKRLDKFIKALRHAEALS